MTIPSEEVKIIISYYIDLGTSSYVAQMAVAVALGGLATAGFYWRRIVSWFKGLRNGRHNKKP